MDPNVLLFFIDGIGLGGDDPARNPLLDLFRPLTGRPFARWGAADGEMLRFRGGAAVMADAVLGVPGLPQSATGQTSIFTGINAQAFLGYHLTAFPNQELKELIMKNSVMKQLAEDGVPVTSANLYTKEFFSRRGNNPRAVYPASTVTILASGVPFRFADEYRNGKAVFADITNRLAVERGYSVPVITPEEGGLNCAAVFDDHRFVFFEYFMTDVYGHKRDRENLARCVDEINRFLLSLKNKRGDVHVLVVSDHGNAEDISTGSHTDNPVPVILFSDRADFVQILSPVADITDIVPLIRRLYGKA